MSNREVEYEQLPDYAVIHVDDVILQLGSDNCKLIFYQNITKTTDDNKDIDKQKKYKRLKFEVRLPHRALENLATTVLALTYAQKNALELVKGNRDPNTTRSWWEVANTIESSYYDTENSFLSKTDTDKLIQSFMDLGVRVMNLNNPKDGNMNASNQ